MRIGTFAEYRGITGTIEYDDEDKIHYGELLNTENYTSGYHANTIEELYIRFKNAVDNYLYFKHGNIIV